jgi:hypothetical protein
MSEETKKKLQYFQETPHWMRVANKFELLYHESKQHFRILMHQYGWREEEVALMERYLNKKDKNEEEKK